MERRPEIGLKSYDRFFPNQDTLPVGGFGNLIALPLQRRPRELDNSVFSMKISFPIPTNGLSYPRSGESTVLPPSASPARRKRLIESSEFGMH